MTQSVQRGAGPSSLDPHFGYVRFGVGRSGLSRSFDNLPQLGRPADYEPVTFQGFSSFLDQQNVINGIANRCRCGPHRVWRWSVRTA